MFVQSKHNKCPQRMIYVLSFCTLSPVQPPALPQGCTPQDSHLRHRHKGALVAPLLAVPLVISAAAAVAVAEAAAAAVVEVVSPAEPTSFVDLATRKPRTVLPRTLTPTTSRTMPTSPTTRTAPSSAPTRPTLTTATSK